VPAPVHSSVKAPDDPALDPARSPELVDPQPAAVLRAFEKAV